MDTQGGVRIYPPACLRHRKSHIAPHAVATDISTNELGSGTTDDVKLIVKFIPTKSSTSIRRAARITASPDVTGTSSRLSTLPPPATIACARVKGLPELTPSGRVGMGTPLIGAVPLTKRLSASCLPRSRHIQTPPLRSMVPAPGAVHCTAR